MERSYHVYNDVEFDEGAFVGFDKDNNVCIEGNHVTNIYYIKYSLLKYSQSVGISSISSEIPGIYSLYQNYPNPFNPSIIINFSILKSGQVRLSVYYMTGR